KLLHNWRLEVPPYPKIFPPEAARGRKFISSRTVPAGVPSLFQNPGFVPVVTEKKTPPGPEIRSDEKSNDVRTIVPAAVPSVRQRTGTPGLPGSPATKNK